MSALTLARAQELLDYDPLTGVFRWKVDRPGRGAKKAGDVAGTRREDGYLTVMIDGKRYLLHRIAWLLMTGTWPTFTVDHEDVNPSNNRWKNLREATGAQNSANRKVQTNNRLGLKGVRERNGRYLASISIKGKARHLGCFDTPQEASDAYAAAARKEFGDYACV